MDALEYFRRARSREACKLAPRRGLLPAGNDPTSRVRPRPVLTPRAPCVSPIARSRATPARRSHRPVAVVQHRRARRHLLTPSFRACSGVSVERSPRRPAYDVSVRRLLRPTKPGKIALIVVWTVVAVFVLSNLSEDARGDPFFLHLISWDFKIGAIGTAVALGIDAMARLTHRFVKPS